MQGYVLFEDLMRQHQIPGTVAELSRYLRLNSETGHNAVDREAYQHNERAYRSGASDLSAGLDVQVCGDPSQWWVREEHAPALANRFRLYHNIKPVFYL